MDTVAGAQTGRAVVHSPRRTGADTRRFDHFYARHYRDVAGLAYTLTGSWAAAEDIAQDAFVRAYRAWPRVGGLDRSDTWVRTVAVNLATSRGRRLAAEARALTRLRSRRTPEGVSLPDDADAFWRAVRRLPRRQGQAVALHYHSDLSLEDVAAVMGCAQGTVKAHLHAARRKLAAELDVAEGDTR